LDPIKIPGREENTYIAKTFEGLEEVLAKELSSQGAKDTEIIKRGVKFTGNKKLLYSVNYNCRTALRILSPIAEFKAGNEKELYEACYNIPWAKYFDIDKTFAIDSVISYSTFKHSGFVSLKTKDAVVDRFRKDFGRRPSVDTNEPDIRINVHIFRERCTVSLDSSGRSLHIRGYKTTNVPAPINEVLAAGLIQLSGWEADSVFIDPMCGSGTILLEAAMFARNIPAGKFRSKYTFESWKDFEPKLFKEVKEEAAGKIRPFTHRMIGSDISRNAFEAARRNIGHAGLARDIRIHKGAFDEFLPPSEGGFLITNPPYGERLETEDIVGLYQSLGDTLKTDYQGYTAWVLSGDLEALKLLGLKASQKIKVYNGQLECRFAKFEIYKGSRKYGDSGEVNSEGEQ